MRDISRWMKTFNIHDFTKEWIGKGLCAEMVPLTSKTSSGKHTIITPKPWAYIYNIVEHIFKHLQN